MKFPRNARIFRGRLDVAPFAAVFFLLVIFLLCASLVYTPGVALQLPMAEDLPGTDQPSIAVAIDGNGRLYYRNQLISEPDLRVRLAAAAKASAQPLVLVIEADKRVSYERLIDLTSLARQASTNIHSAWLATLPAAIPGRLHHAK